MVENILSVTHYQLVLWMTSIDKQ